MVKERDFSQLFEVEIPNLAVGKHYSIDLSQMPYGKYLPFNFVMIQNNSQQRVRLIINDGTRKVIPPGTIFTFDSATIPAVWSIKVVNLGNDTINAGEVYVSFQKIPNVLQRSFKVLGGDL